MSPPPPRSTLFPYTTLFRSSAETLQSYLPVEGINLPTVINDKRTESDFTTEREILYKVLFDMKSDLNDLRSEEHTSELQSRENLVCRLLLEKKKTKMHKNNT